MFDLLLTLLILSLTDLLARRQAAHSRDLERKIYALRLEKYVADVPPDPCGLVNPSADARRLAVFEAFVNQLEHGQE